jgi:putative ABC transport system permease protein
MLKVTLKGLLAHKIRFALTTFAVVIGVAFVVGAFTLTDSVRRQFDTLFAEINAGVDLTVRGAQVFEGDGFGGGLRPPVPEELLDRIAALPGVEAVNGTAGGVPALLIGDDGEPVEALGGPPLGISWPIDDRMTSSVRLAEGRKPEAPGEIVVDVDLAARGDFAVGDRVRVQTPLGPGEYEIVGTFTFGESNALAGATLTGFTLAEAQRLYNLEGKLQTIEVALAGDASPDAVADEIRAVLPPGTEVVGTQQVVEESQAGVGEVVGIFGNVLLGFAGVTLFVSAFLISNTFTIVVGQRVRELALLRAIGASARQVGTSVLGEALVIGALSSLLGFVLGLLMALGLQAILSAGGFGTEGTVLVVSPRSVLAAAVVGVGVTLLSALSPARRATKVPPVAAMREGYSLQGTSITRRALGGAAMIVVGSVLLAVALFGNLDTVPLVVGMVAGALLVFLGVALASPTVARPLARAVGTPLAAVYRIVGRLAEENASRNPRRTASTASALMVGLALVSMALIVGTSIKRSFAETLQSSITADWYVTTGSFFGFSPEVAARMRGLDELGAVSGGRFGQVQVDGSTKTVNAVDFAVLDQLFDLDVQEGGIEPGARGVLVQTDPATDLGLAPGDTVTLVFPETGPQELPVLAVYEDSSVLGNWVIDLDTYQENFTENLDVYVAATTAEGVEPAAARAAIESVVADFPELRVQDRTQFRKDQESQLDQLLLVVNVFLALAIVIAFIGIMNTLALSVFERTRELGLLRAVGMARRQVRRMIRLEAVIVAVFGALLGVVVGVLFGVSVTVALPDDLVDTVAVPVAQLVIIVVLAGLVGVVAALWPAWRAGRLDVLTAIATE